MEHKRLCALGEQVESSRQVVPHPWKHPKERRKRVRHSSRGSARHGNTSTSTETINIGASPTAACCAPELGLVEKASEAGIRQREAARYQSKAPDKLEMVSQSTKPLYNHGKVVTLSQLVAVGWQLCSFHSWWQIEKGTSKYFLRCPLSRDTARGSQELSFPSCSLLCALKALRSLHVNSRHLSFGPYLSCRAHCPTQGAYVCVFA